LLPAWSCRQHSTAAVGFLLFKLVLSGGLITLCSPGWALVFSAKVLVFMAIAEKITLSSAFD